MKELSIEEKAKAYDEASKWMENVYPTLSHEQQMEAEVFFPMFKEPEGEKTRKEIMEYITLYKDSLGDDEYRTWIAWLEKQVEQKLPIEKLPSEMKTIGESLGVTTQKECNEYNQMVSDLIMSDGDKVEPKFKVGDWVVFDGETLHITNVTENGYSTEDGVIPFRCEKETKLWTIDDAKEGDVLCDYHEACDNPLIFILKKFECVYFGLTRPSDYSSYCFLTASDGQRFKEGTYHHAHNIKPATKEQRDLLFLKMKEAGYEWNAEKKELKKIEQKSAEWSEEDEKKRKRIMHRLSIDGTINNEDLADINEWLKSPRLQSHWKPSEEQIKAVRLARSFVVDDFDEHPTLSEILIELEEQLKKLK